MQCRINVVKVKYKFADNEMSGLEIRLAPKVKKFIAMTKDNKDLLDLMGNGLAMWFDRAEYGDDIDFIWNIPDNPREKVVVPVQQADKPAENIDTSNFWS